MNPERKATASPALELDLSFAPLPESKVLLIAADPGDRQLLTSADPWQHILSSWLNTIRCDMNQQCPEVVRLTPAASLGLQFTDDASIAALNASWRHRDGATDVLSFAALEDSMVLPGCTSIELGDIIVSIETAARQAQDHQHGLEQELRWLVSHGLLHLLGWDHPDEGSLGMMLSYQQHLLGINVMVQPLADGRGDATNKTTNLR
ncbi:MAG: rRNA maturation RNase YbeY [Prochlorococcus sp.]